MKLKHLFWEIRTLNVKVHKENEAFYYFYTQLGLSFQFLIKQKLKDLTHF